MISDLSLSHFRSHRHLRLVLDGRPVAIFGPNGAGKTAILEAVSMLSPGRGLRRAAPAELARRPEALGWKVAATVVTGEGSREIETGAAPGEARSVLVDGKAATQTALGRVLRLIWLVPAMDRLWIEGAEGRRRFLDRMTLSFEPAHADVSLAYERAMRERNRLLREGLRDARWFDALEAQMAASGAAIAAGRAMALARIAAAQDAAATAFPAADLALVAPDDAPADRDEAGLRAALAEGRERDMAAGRTLAGPHRDDLRAVWRARGMEASLCSTGEQKALLVSLVLSNARALAGSGAAPVLLLDEIAAHLDDGRRAALYDEVVALGVQALMTGTGPELFAALGARGDRLEVTEAEGASQVRRA
ncbi:MAG: DNA replication/repair protein RecF [Rhodobacteraceae bacterium]|nr:DNA replication/repair protein RecF [Paracoccaceae bacterium]